MAQGVQTATPGALRAASAPDTLPLVRPGCDGRRRPGAADWRESILRLGRDTPAMGPDEGEADTGEAGLPLSVDGLWELIGDMDEDKLALLGTRLFVLAVNREMVPRSVWKLAADKLQIDAIARKALGMADYAKWTVDEMKADLDAIRTLIRSLEERIDRQTPGVGEPR